MIYPNKWLYKNLVKKNLSSFCLELIPRSTYAQSMDVLSSQATVGGYRAVINAASHMSKFFPMLMTPAGTIKPATVLVLGAGGGAKAVCFYLKSCRYNFYIYNRSELKAKEISRLLFNDTSCALNKNEPIHNIDIVINCLPRSIEPFDFLNKSCIEISDLSYFIDINYNTKCSKLNGVKVESTINGVDMLIYQAIKSNEIWLGTNILDRLDVKYIKENLTEN